MFQIACSIGYARKYGYQWAADTGSGVSDPYSAIHKVFPNLPKENWGSGQRYHEHPNEFCRIHNVHKNECHFDYHPIPDLGPNVSLTGFFQSWKYFEGQDEEIKKVFALPHVEGYEDHVSIHVRRGDYVQHSGSFPPIDMEYITKAVDIIYEKTGLSRFSVFSDDIVWCENNISYNPVKYTFGFVQENDEFKSLSLMASNKHHIIANSTFSWWGAYLGHNPNKIVVSPSCVRGNWFGYQAGVKRDVVDLLPKEWIQIKFR